MHYSGAGYGQLVAVQIRHRLKAGNTANLECATVRQREDVLVGIEGSDRALIDKRHRSGDAADNSRLLPSKDGQRGVGWRASSGGERDRHRFVLYRDELSALRTWGGLKLICGSVV